MSGSGTVPSTTSADTVDARFTADTLKQVLQSFAVPETPEQKAIKALKDSKLWVKFFKLSLGNWHDCHANLRSILYLADCEQLLDPDVNGVPAMTPAI